MDDLPSKIIAWIVHNFGVHPSAINIDTPLFSSGALDSFNMIELIVFVEQQNNIKIKPMDVNLDNLDSVRKITQLIDGLAN